MSLQKKIVIIAGPNGAGKQPMSTVPHTPIVSRLADADMQAVPAALARAAQSARELAARTGTPLVVTRDGQLIAAVIQLDDANPGNDVSHKH